MIYREQLGTWARPWAWIGCSWRWGREFAPHQREWSRWRTQILPGVQGDSSPRPGPSTALSGSWIGGAPYQRDSAMRCRTALRSCSWRGVRHGGRKRKWSLAHEPRGMGGRCVWFGRVDTASRGARHRVERWRHRNVVDVEALLSGSSWSRGLCWWGGTPWAQWTHVPHRGSWAMSPGGRGWLWYNEVSPAMRTCATWIQDLSIGNENNTLDALGSRHPASSCRPAAPAWLGHAGSRRGRPPQSMSPRGQGVGRRSRTPHRKLNLPKNNVLIDSWLDFLWAGLSVSLSLVVSTRMINQVIPNISRMSSGIAVGPSKTNGRDAVGYVTLSMHLRNVGFFFFLRNC